MKPAPPPKGNLAISAKVSASWTSRFDKVERVNDGLSNFRAVPNNRWTSYESLNDSDWVRIEFGEKKSVGRVELHIYDDRGGVRAPESYLVQYWDGAAWKDIEGQLRRPEKPTGSTVNSVTFPPLETEQLRVIFTHKGKARSGLTEIEVWNK